MHGKIKPLLTEDRKLFNILYLWIFILNTSQVKLYNFLLENVIHLTITYSTVKSIHATQISIRLKYVFVELSYHCFQIVRY